MKKIAITYPDFFDGEADKIVSLLINGDFWRVHIRKPGSTPDAMAALIAAIPEALRNRLSVHDHFHLATQMHIGGVHLNSRNCKVPDGWRGLTSRSIHSIAEIASVSEDYAFLSPIYPSISKPGYRAEFNRDELRIAVNPKIFALGGVTPDRIAELESIGFGGAAMLGSVWRATIGREAFRLQLITNPSDAHSVVDGARLALNGGCRWVQLRHKDAGRGQLVDEGGEIMEACREVGATFIVDDHVEVVRELGADGVHLGKNDMPVSEARKILGPSKIIGATANTFDDIARAWRDGADYVGLGPFRFTTTKKNLSPVLGIEGYHSIFERCRAEGIGLPIVAIGGIMPDDIPQIIAAGASGTALSGCILNSTDPSAKTKEIINILNNI